MLYWECKRRLTDLHTFRGLVARYFGSVNYSRRATHQTETSEEAREKINLLMAEIEISCILIRQPTIVSYFDPRSGYEAKLSILQNIFELRQYYIENARVVDSLDRAIGEYERLQHHLYRQMFNPVFWLSLVLAKLVSLPFQILGMAGFDSAKLQKSTGGKILKAVIGFVAAFIAFAAGLLTILQILGWLDPALKVLHIKK